MTEGTDRENAERLLTPAQAAEFLQIPKSTLAVWRTKKMGVGPAYRKHGRRVTYAVSDLMTWSNGRRIPPQET